MSMASQTDAPAAGLLEGSFEHEQLEIFHDHATGLTGAVAIHSTALGPAMGGLRLHRYPHVAAAAQDALRLARAMTLKNSAAGLSFGGGKAVLLDDGAWAERREARMLAFADRLQRLQGHYVTAEDVGTTPADMDLIAARTSWVAGLSPANGGGGDPSLATARTVFGAIETAVSMRLGRSLEDVRVGVLGTGKVGGSLVAMLIGAGAEVSAADVDRARAEASLAAAGGGEIAPLDGFLERDLDVLAPCALGELIAAADVGRLRCRVVAGAANNPLLDRAAASALHQAGILYVPDFIANCGGIVQVAAEYEHRDAAELDAQLDACVARARLLLADSLERGVAPIELAVEHALARVAAAM